MSRTLRIPRDLARQDGLPDPDLLCRSIWNRLWPTEAWPWGWTCHWVSHEDAWGYCDYDMRRVELDPELQGRPKYLTATICHELQHLRLGPSAVHGRHFDALERKLALRLGVEFIEKRKDNE